MDELENSEWEFVYDDTETETFYVTLDTSSFSPPPRPQPRHTTGAANKKAPISSPPPEQEYDQSTSNLDPRLAPNPSAHSALTTENRMDESGAPSVIDGDRTGRSAETVQILDLGSSNPLLSRNGQLFSCTWGSTLGTDLFLAASQSSTDPSSPADDTNPSTPPLRSLPGVDLLGTSRIKLSAKPVNAIPRPHTHPPTTTANGIPTAPESTSVEASSSTATGPTVRHEPEYDPPVSILAPAGASTARHNQAAFLSKLVNIKRQRGELGDVTVMVSNKMDLEPEQRRKGLVASMQERAARRPRGRPRRGRGGRVRTATGTAAGQEPRPVPGPEPGEDMDMDMDMMSSRMRSEEVLPTPARWADLDPDLEGDNLVQEQRVHREERNGDSAVGPPSKIRENGMAMSVDRVKEGEPERSESVTEEEMREEPGDQ